MYKFFKYLSMTTIILMLFSSCASKEEKNENNLETATDNVSKSVKNFNNNIRDFIKKNKTDKSEEDDEKKKK